jgi:hypothetical protein
MWYGRRLVSITPEYLISLNFRAMVDKFSFMAVYGSKTTLETKVPAAIRTSFNNLTMDRHKVEGARDQFAAAWKTYLWANQQQAPEVDACPDKLFMLMMGASIMLMSLLLLLLVVPTQQRPRRRNWAHICQYELIGFVSIDSSIQTNT